MGLRAGVSRCLLLCAVLLVLPAIVASQLTPLTVQRVWTQNTGGIEKTSFLPGETIQFAAELNNPYGGWLLGANGTRLTITTNFYTDTKSVDIPPGISTWTWNATAPSTEDTYTVTVQAYDHASGTLPVGSANFTITLGQAPPPEQICHTFDDQQPVREGWGAAYDVFSADHEVLLKATCTPNETQITVGNNNADTYIYHQAHYWINEQEDGDKELQCIGEKVDNWCVGAATAVIPVQSQYYAAYTCRKIDGSWKCGCRDTQCAESLWQLQQVERGQAPTAPSNDGLRFPLQGETPYTAAVSSIQDHSMTTPYTRDNVVEAFNGERGERANGHLCYDTACAVVGYKCNVDNSPCDLVDLTYDGGAFLFYDGHPGYDYPAALGTPIYAPANGTLCVATTATQSSGSGSLWRDTQHCPEDLDLFVRSRTLSSWTSRHTFYIIHRGLLINGSANDYMTVFLHNEDLESSVRSDVEQNGYAEVNADQHIAKVGGFGAGGANHMHLEVFKYNTFTSAWDRDDPYGDGINNVLWFDTP